MEGFLANSSAASRRRSIPLLPQCGPCGLHRKCLSPKMKVDGNGSKRVMIFGEAPGKDEDSQGQPFVGKSGELIEKELGRVGLDLREDCWIVNAARCRPPKNKMPPKTVEHCRPFSVNDVLELKPEVIILLGGSAVKSLIGWLWKEDVGEVGRWTGLRIPAQKINAWVCHPSGTEITTKGGLTTIEKINPGEIVLTHEGNWRPVTEVIRRDFVGNILGVQRAYQSMVIEGTPEHPLLVKRGGIVAWLPLSEIVLGDYLIEPVPSGPDEVVDGRIVWKRGEIKRIDGRGHRRASGSACVRANYHAMRLLGYYLAEGCVSKKGGGISFSLHAKEREYLEEIKESFRVVFDSDTNFLVRRPAKSNGIELVCAKANAADFFRTAGSGSLIKRFPSWVWDCSDELICTMLRSLWNGDGCVSGGVHMSIQSSSRQLMEDVRRAMLRLGVVGNIRFRRRDASNWVINGRKTNANNSWEVSLRGKWAEIFSSLLGIDLPNLPKNRANLDRAFIEKGLAYYKVEKIGIRRRDVSLPVYNLEVAEDHSFLAWGISSHNCPTWHPSYIMRSDYGAYKGRNDRSENQTLTKLFQDHLRDAAALVGTRPWKNPPDWKRRVRAVLDPEEAASEIKRMTRSGRPMAFDFETDRLKPDCDGASIFCCSVSDGRTAIGYPWHGAAVLATLNFIVSDVPKIGWNMKFEDRWSRKVLGVSIKPPWLWDGMLAAHVLDNRPKTKSLEFQEFALLGFESHKAEIGKYFKAAGTYDRNTIHKAPLSKVLEYCAWDSFLEWKAAARQMRMMGVEMP